jgi:putative hydrolase of the HAD superfamily
MNLRLPQAILFDLDDTILAFDQVSRPCWQSICARFAPRLGDVSPEALLAAIQESRAWFWSDPDRHRQGRLDLKGARLAIVGRALTWLGADAPGPQGVPDLAIGIAEAYATEREEAIRPLPGAVEALRTLKGYGLRLALITNGQSEPQRRKIERFSLGQFFDCILIEGEIGAGKPDQRVYRHALAQLGVEPSQAWMVGDHLEWDVEAPQRVGVAGIWVDVAGSGLPASSPVRPDRIVRSVAELVEG